MTDATTQSQADADASDGCPECGAPQGVHNAHCSTSIRERNREIEELRAALADTLRMLEAVRYTTGLGKGQMERIAKARALLPDGKAQRR
jgi:hypothetical protein